MSSALALLLALKLCVSGLFRSYPRFTLFIGWLFLESATLALAVQFQHTNKTFYAEAWIVTRAVALVLEVLAVREIFVLWTAHHPGIGTFGRGLLWAVLILGFGVGLALIPINATKSGWPLAYQLVTVLNRSVQGGLVVFLAATLSFFLVCGSPVIKANLRRHSWAMLAFMSANVIGYFAAAAHSFRLASPILIVIAISAEVYWATALTKSGETVPVITVEETQLAWAENFTRGLLRMPSDTKL